MPSIRHQLNKQIAGWRLFSAVAPAVFLAVAGVLNTVFSVPFQTIFYIGLVILSVTCISWWHWSLSTMMTMIGIMKDTDDHFEEINAKLTKLILDAESID